MKSKKRMKIAKILLTIIILAAGTFLYLNHGPKVEISYESEFLLGKPIKMNIKTYDNFKAHSPESLEVSISNRYNKNESMTEKITPFEEGKYELFITPHFAGEYQLHATYKDGETTKNFSESFLVE